MTLRALLSFDQVPSASAIAYSVYSTYSSANPFNQVYGVPGTVMTGSSANNATMQPAGANGPNWLCLGQSSTSLSSGYVISFADLGWLQNGVTQGWMGFRTYANSTGGNASSVVGLLTAGSIGNQGASITSLLTEAQLARQATGPAGAQYVEVFLDLTALTYQTYVNGVPNTNGSIPANMQYVVFGGQNYGSASQFWKDFYFLDVDSTKPNGRLGPITATALVPAAANVQLPNYGNYIATITGTSVISNAQSKFGNGSYFPGTTASSACSVADNVNLRCGSTGDFTIECWVNPTTLSQTGVVFAKDNSTANSAHLTLASGSWNVFFDSSTLAINMASGMTVGTWYHVALVKYNGTWTLYQNGVALATFAGGTFGNNALALTVGNWGALANPFQGYIDELRVSTLARYTTAFTPPTAAFSPDANTSLLYHFDSSVNGYVGDYSGAQPSPLQTIYGGTPAMTPFLQNAASNDQLTANFAPVVANGQKVVAMQYKLAAQVPFAINMLSNLKQGATVKALPTYQIRDTIAQYSRDMAGIQTTAPDGTAWSATNIAATSLLLQPQSASDPALS